MAIQLKNTYVIYIYYVTYLYNINYNKQYVNITSTHSIIIPMNCL